MVVVASIIPVLYQSRQLRPYRNRSNANNTIVISVSAVGSWINNLRQRYDKCIALEHK